MNSTVTVGEMVERHQILYVYCTRMRVALDSIKARKIDRFIKKLKVDFLRALIKGTVIAIDGCTMSARDKVCLLDDYFWIWGKPCTKLWNEIMEVHK